MLHANAFLVDVQQSGIRGRDKLFSTNWLMPMVNRQFGRHGLTFRAMISLEPATITKREYPLLFQTGETAHGLSILDGQHPHVLFMELAARYDVSAAERTQVSTDSKLLCGFGGLGITSIDDKRPTFDHVVVGPDGSAVTIDERPIGRVQSYTMGYERELPSGTKRLNIGVGAQVTLYSLPSLLRTLYGDHPSTIAVFVRVRPAGNLQEHMKEMHR